MHGRGALRASIDGIRAIVPVLLGVAPFGLLFGALVVRAGLPTAAAIGLSLVVFAGASQFAFVQLATAGAPLAVVALGAIVLNLRHLLYSASLAPHLGRLSPIRRWAAAYYLTDEAYAVAIRRAGEGAPHVAAFYAGAGVTLWICWLGTTIAGALVGTSLPDSPLYAFTLPLTFLAIVVTSLRDGRGLAVAAAAAVLGVALAGLPLGLGLIAASASAIALGVLLDMAGA